MLGRRDNRHERPYRIDYVRDGRVLGDSARTLESAMARIEARLSKRRNRGEIGRIYLRGKLVREVTLGDIFAENIAKNNVFLKSQSVSSDYDNAPTDPHHGGKIWRPDMTFDEEGAEIVMRKMAEVGIRVQTTAQAIFMRDAIVMAVQSEREACAKEADYYAKNSATARSIAKDIRKRAASQSALQSREAVSQSRHSVDKAGARDPLTDEPSQ